MILSIHIRKCAGSSLRKSLERAYGPAALFDYGDQIGSSWPSSVARRRTRYAKAVEHKADIEQGTKIIHGHFLPQKYDFLETPKTYVTMLRDPVRRVASNYHYLRRSPERSHPDALILHQLGFSLIEFANHPDNRNFQTQCIAGRPLNAFAFVGWVEAYDRCLIRLEDLLGVGFGDIETQNVNATAAIDYDLSRQERCALENANLEDMRLYDAARNQFEQRATAA